MRLHQISGAKMSRLIGNIGGSDIVEDDDGSVTFLAGAQLDGDGANGQFGSAPCYAPPGFSGKTLDVLANAGEPGNFFGIVTDNGRADGTPVIQGPEDPCPGAYVSPTSLHLPGQDGRPLPNSSPFKYVDAATVPFVVVPATIIRGVAGVVLGCRAIVTNTTNGKSVEAVVADGGPANKLGEISLACAKAIGVPVNENSAHPANSGGIAATSHVIHYQLFPGVAASMNGVTYPLQHS
jgi:hypothetical protein